jgi:copper chaperone
MSTNVKQEFAVEGMSCGGCVASVTRAIKQLGGVQNVDVSLQKKAATVDYDSSALNSTAIIAAIEAAGFEATAR